MINFADEAKIEIYSGRGGNGCVAFRREKYIPKGGPNGGDGGRGGDIIFIRRDNVRTLSKIRYHHIYKAQNGSDGMGQNKHGKDGEDTLIAVPPGSLIKDAETGELLHDFAKDADSTQFIAAHGGKGGWGNTHFKSATNQAPRYAHEGSPGECKKLIIEMSIIADVGLVGFPNAGKSSLIRAFTNARPKVAPYPFTTKIPHLGVLRVDNDEDIIIADIPGIIEGASTGKGLGHNFLKHISRTRALIFMIDASDDNYLTAYDALCKELETYDPNLLDKKRLVLCNKIDIDGAEERANEIRAAIQEGCDVAVIAISVLCNTNLGNARNAIIELFNKSTLSSGKSEEQGD